MSGPLPSLLVPILMEELRPGQSGEDRVPTWAGGCSNFWGGVGGCPVHGLSTCCLHVLQSQEAGLKEAA